MKNNSRNNLILTMIILLVFAFLLYKLYYPVGGARQEDSKIVYVSNGVYDGYGGWGGVYGGWGGVYDGWRGRGRRRGHRGRPGRPGRPGPPGAPGTPGTPPPPTPPSSPASLMI